MTVTSVEANRAWLRFRYFKAQPEANRFTRARRRRFVIVPRPLLTNLYVARIMSGIGS